jgi:hypothetical protein
MQLAKWYLVCDRVNKRAIDLIVLPDIWGQATGLRNQSDEDLEFFWQWSPHTETNFLTVDRALELDYDIESITNVLDMNRPAVLEWVRSMRDPVLAATDSIIVSDRWSSLDVVAQNDATVFRNALRDLTTQQDLFRLKWPSIPPALNFLRKMDVSAITQPSEEFLAMFSEPYPALSLAARRSNMWLRIKAERDRRINGGIKIMVDGKAYWFWTDDPSCKQYALLDGHTTRNNMAVTQVINNWKTMSGEFVPMTVAILREVIGAGISNEGAIFDVAEDHNKAMVALEEPESYDFSQGWPASFEEYQAAMGLM